LNRRDILAWRASLVLMAASGFAGLGYQIVWTQQCALWLGHEAAAVLAVVAAFFGGLAVGALALGPRIERSDHPARWYAACEATIALWSAVLLTLLAPFGEAVLVVTGVQPSPAWQWTVAFCATFVVLLPATAAMGATLPAIERVFADRRAGARSIAPHYAANTFGATLGVLAIAFWLVPALGLSRTAAICVALNLLCAVFALVVLPRTGPVAPRERPPSSPDGNDALVRLAFTGLFGIGYEVLVVRVLGQLAEDTVYTFALLLAVYLVGTAIGAALYQRWLASRREPARLGDRLLCAQAAACLIGAASLWLGERLKAGWLDVIGASLAAAIGAEALLAVTAFALPTIVMGALFSHLGARSDLAGIGFGRALGVNTLGAAAAPVVFGVLLAPALGPKLALMTIALGYVALARPRAWRRAFAWGSVAAAIAIAWAAPPLAFVDVPEGGRVVSYREGTMAAVSVVEDGNGVATLRINNRQQEGSSATLHVDARQALLPILLHPAPRRALFLGLGTGMTATSAAGDPALEVDAVELLPEVIAASAEFTRVFDDASRRRVHLLAADARRYVRATSQRYDVIVADNFHPARSGSGSLYTVEHFRAVRERLAHGGLFCQWLPLHQLDLATLRSIVRSFLVAYPDGWALLASNSLETPVLGLVARVDGERFDVAAVRRRLDAAARSMTASPASFGIEDEFALLGCFVAGPRALARFANDARLNTDDDPVVAYAAPRFTYAAMSAPQDRLIEWLDAVSIAPEELIAGASDVDGSRRLAAYWRARRRFIEAGRGIRPSTDVRDMLARVREPLLSVLRLSPDFRPAYDPLLRMAAALERSDADAAHDLLTELDALQPERREAASALRRLESAQAR
jgi:spermidine synthase